MNPIATTNRKDLKTCLKLLKSAKCPEDIFGKEEAEYKSYYRDWAKGVHEDLFGAKNKPIARECFQLLQVWKDRAEKKIGNGTYGDMKPTVTAVLKTKTATYVLTGLVAKGDMCDLYDSFDTKGNSLLVKIVRNPRNNDLMQAEARALADLNAEFTKDAERKRIPPLLDSFEIQQGKEKRRVNVFVPFANSVSLTQVHEAYPVLDVRDAAWIFNRMIDGLFVLHNHGRLHGAVTPDHFLIEPATHLGMFVDYCYSLKAGDTIKAIANDKWRAFYPPEVFEKKPAGYGTDVFMAASCMIYLLGGDVIRGNLPAAVPRPIAGLLRACRMHHVSRRSDDIFELHKEFNEVLKALYGPKKFREFKMPALASS